VSELETVGGGLAIFCRVGCCFMLLPGISSVRAPMIVRLWLAIGLSVAIAPLVLATGLDLSAFADALGATGILIAEGVTGASLGLLVRFVYSAVQAGGGLIAQVSGYNQDVASDDGHGGSTSELGALLGMTVVALLMVLDIHHLAIGALVNSYSTFTFGQGIDVVLAMENLPAAAGDALRLALTMALPFIAASLLVNFAFGILNRLAPQLPVFFISTAFLIAVMMWMASALLPSMAVALAEATLAVFERY
jgi:flagellar biosynthetic protein FliR